MKAVRLTIRRSHGERCATSVRELDLNQGRCVAACRPGEGRPATPADGVAEAGSMRRTTRHSEATMARMHAVFAWLPRPHTGCARVPA
ncbi:hypothetical protein OH687_28305 [Burkholderia anthina]|nr:hypothetical protein OH687_28305 [Burkholderia anthina]